MSFSHNQIRHDVINLHKTIKLLEDTVNNEDWERYTAATQNAKWLKAQTVLGGVRHCRNVLATLPHGDYSLGVRDSELLVDDVYIDKKTITLDRLEKVAAEANEVLQPRPRKLGLTAKLPKPKPRVAPTLVVKKSVEELPAADDDEKSDAETAVDVSHQEESLAHNLLDPLEDVPEPVKDVHATNPASSLISRAAASTSTTSTKATGTPAFLKTSTALQDDLAGQLAQMAEQLKRNAIHFSESLEKDKGALKDTEEKLDANYDSLGKERVRLRDHRGKSKGTTWLVVVSIFVVIISFILMLFIMRIT